jgi:hypothetical protein
VEQLELFNRKTRQPRATGSRIEGDLPKLAEHFKATWDNRSINPSYMTILTAKHAAAVTI